MSTDTHRAESARNNPLNSTLSTGVHVTSRGVLVPIERWRALTEAMLDTAAKAAIAAEYMIERCDDFDGDSDLEGQCTEDEISRAPDFGPQFLPTGPGCEIADTGEDSDPDHEHDGREPTYSDEG